MNITADDIIGAAVKLQNISLKDAKVFTEGCKIFFNG